MAQRAHPINRTEVAYRHAAASHRVLAIAAAIAMASCVTCRSTGASEADSSTPASVPRRSPPVAAPRETGPHPISGTSPPAMPDVLVSRQLLEEARLAIGETVRLATAPSGTGARPFRIAGVYEPTPDPMKITLARREMRLHLSDLLALVADPRDPLAAETVDAVNVRLRDPEEAPRFIEDVRARLPGVTAFSTREAGDTTFAVLDRFHRAIAIVTVLGSTAFLLALMVMRADERRETVGILRLIGLSRRRILAEVLCEGLLIAAAGAIFGVAFAATIEGAVNRFFQWRYDTALVFMHVTPGIVVQCIALAVPLGVLAGLVASWTVLRGGATTMIRR